MANKPADGIIEIEYPGPLVTRKFVDQIMHNVRIMVTDVKGIKGLKDDWPTPNTVNIEIDDEPDNSDEDSR